MIHLVAALLAANFAWIEPAPTEPPEDAAQKAEQREFSKWAGESAASYDIRLTTAPDTPLALRSEPVLKWSNPERGRIYGDVFIWTADGRPEAIASLYKWYHPFTHSSHEFQSLSLGSLTATRDGSAVGRRIGRAWSCDRSPTCPHLQRPRPSGCDRCAPSCANFARRRRTARAN